MIRFLVNTAVFMTAAAIGLLVADIALDGLSVAYPIGFIEASLVFGILSAVLTPLFDKVARGNASMLAAGVGLFTALISLFLTATLLGQLSVDGLTTWLAAALIIWLASMVAGFILKVTVAKRFVKEVRN